MHKIIKYSVVYFMAALKFIGGVIAGTVEKLTFIETALFTFLGSMTTIVIVTYLGNRYRSGLAQFFRGIKIWWFRFTNFFRWLLFRNEKYTRNELRNMLVAMGKSKKFSRMTRIVVKSYRKFGLWGIAWLTPFLLSPLGGSLIAVSFRIPTRKTIIYMAIVHAIMAVVLAYLFNEFKDFIQVNLGIQLEK